MNDGPTALEAATKHATGTALETATHHIARLAARVMRAPLAVISVGTPPRQWVESRIPLADPTLTAARSLCARLTAAAIAGATTAVSGDLHIVACLPLMLQSGGVEGTLCVLDLAPREPAPDEVAALGELAALLRQQWAMYGAARSTCAAEAALHRAEERLRTVVANAPVVLFAVDHEGVVTLCEGHGLDALTSSPIQMVGRSLADVRRMLPPLHGALTRALTGEDATAIVQVGGRTFDAQCSPVREEQGRVVGAIGVAVDISEQQRATDALARQNAYLAALHDTTLSLLGRTDANDVLDAVTARAAHLLGVEHGCAWLVRQDGEDETLAASAAIGAFSRLEGYRVARGEGLAGTVWQSAAPLVVDDDGGWMCRSRDVPFRDVRACMGVPLTSGDRVTGVLMMASTNARRRFQPEDLDLLSRFAHLASVALDRAALSAALRSELADRRQAEAALLASEARFRSLVQHASDIITVLDARGTILYESPAVQPLVSPGTAPAALLDTIHPADVQKVVDHLTWVSATPGVGASIEFRRRRHDGAWRHVEAIANNLLDDPSVQGIVVTSRDITERKRFQLQLEHLAFYDRLTGLPNRVLFMDRLEQALANTRGAHPCAQGRRGLAVLFLDLDRFKVVNDSLGHGVGDQLLVSAGERLSGCLRPGDTLSRFGGDEFTILLDGLTDPSEATDVAERIVTAMSRPFTLTHHEAFVSASVGIVHATPRPRTRRPMTWCARRTRRCSRPRRRGAPAGSCLTRA